MCSMSSSCLILQGVGLASLAHSLFMNFETVVSTGWRAGIDCKRVIDSTPSQQKRDRPGYSKDVIDSTPSQQKRDRPGYSRDVIDSTPSHQKRDRPGYSRDVIDST